jgi:hypothetical protein
VDTEKNKFIPYLWQIDVWYNNTVESAGGVLRWVSWVPAWVVLL